MIWVSGRGGWYEISPSAKYRPVYNKMCEATTLYYSIMDTYNSKKFKKLLSKVDMASISQAFLEVRSAPFSPISKSSAIAKPSN